MKYCYIFGYGSLICSQARPELREHFSPSLPVSIAGYKRFWNGCSLSGYAVVGVEREESSSCNGVLLKVAQEDLPSLDAREDAYTRVLVSRDDVTFFSGDDDTDLAIWIYIPKKRAALTEKSPILQSYVDVILHGCLEYGEEFALEFLKKTADWSPHWKNDRTEPLYSRALENPGNTDAVNKLLLATVSFAEGIL